MKIAAIIPTLRRPVPLAECLRSLASSLTPVRRVIVVDASEDHAPVLNATRPPEGLWSAWPFELKFIDAPRPGSAEQRNLGLREIGDAEAVLFLDDDAVPEPDCIGEMMAGLESDSGVGGVAANIVNQPVGRPGWATRVMLRLMGANGGDPSGKLIGPAVAIRPRGDLAEPLIDIEWAATCGVLYRRSALPAGGFDSF
ncbi:MAG: glycosyltransferase family 2 protein, partial [Verrucomicrobiae bacterium]|nr:glycosyltransferase family 2 protein [Verrucomicrobiae bacterium]